MAKQHASRTHLAILQKWGKVNDEALTILHGSGFDLIPNINTSFKINWSLIDHIVDAYDPKGYCFVFGDKKITPTFEDVARITGFPIDGNPVTGKDLREDECRALSTRLLNEDYVRPQSSEIFFNNLLECRKFESPEQIHVYVRAYSLFVISCFLLPGKSQDSVPCMYLSLLEDVHTIKNYAWGAALLCQLHNELQMHKKLGNRRKTSFGFCVPFLEIFFFEHFPIIPQTLYDMSATIEDYSVRLLEFPLMGGWTDVLQLKTKDSYTRPCLDGVLNDQNILWQPYKRLPDNFLPVYLQSQMRLSSTFTVMICFSQFAWHLPFICPLKFGQEEQEDLAQSYDVFELVTKKRNSNKVDWRKFRTAEKPLLSWGDRYSNIVYPSYYEGVNVVEANEDMDNVFGGVEDVLSSGVGGDGDFGGVGDEDGLDDGGTNEDGGNGGNVEGLDDGGTNEDEGNVVSLGSRRIKRSSRTRRTPVHFRDDVVTTSHIHRIHQERKRKKSDVSRREG